MRKDLNFWKTKYLTEISSLNEECKQLNAELDRITSRKNAIYFQIKLKLKKLQDIETNKK